jgi:RNA polymerase sigma-70 factor (ECF subfamily)
VELSGSMKDEMNIQDLYETYSDEIYEFALYSLRNSQDARDTVQEVFLRALVSLHQFRNESSIKTWLFRIARNYIVDSYRRKGIEKNYLPSYVSSESTPIELTLTISDFVMKLNPSQRQVIVLRFIQDLPIKTVAKILNWSSAKVRVTQYRALRQLRTLLEEDEIYGLNKIHSN